MFETLWVLTNISSHSDSNATTVVARSGAVPILISLQEHFHHTVRSQSIWCLGNIAGENSKYRDALVEANIIAGIEKNIFNPESKEILSNCAWLCSNLCRGRPEVKLEVVKKLTPVVFELFR